jgi:hypothetical protein
MTDVISVFQSSPATTFVTEYELMAQDAGRNVSWVRGWIRANNGPGGTTGSFYGNAGRQEIHAQGANRAWGFLGQHSGHPFLPSGYPDGAQRWRDGPYDFEITHDGNGNGWVQFGQRLVYSVDRTDYSAQINLPRIPAAPGAPGPIGYSSILPTSVVLTWGAAPRGHADIDQYSWSLYEDPGLTILAATGTTSGSTLTATAVGLRPGTTYYGGVTAHNGDGWGPPSTITSTRTLSGAYVSDGSSWMPTELFVSDGTNQNVAETYVSDGTTWKPAG